MGKVLSGRKATENPGHPHAGGPALALTSGRWCPLGKDQSGKIFRPEMYYFVWGEAFFFEGDTHAW
jgi:hypothetical protein